jgi:hypothetical protein
MLVKRYRRVGFECKEFVRLVRFRIARERFARSANNPTLHDMSVKDEVSRNSRWNLVD